MTIQSIVFKWRQNSSTTGYASWSRIDTNLNELCLCCGWKAQATSVQSFTLWQQGSMEITSSLLSSPLASTMKFSLVSRALLEDTPPDHSFGITLLLVVHATYVWLDGCNSSRTPFMVNRTFNATPTRAVESEVSSSDSDFGQFRLSDTNSDLQLY